MQFFAEKALSSKKKVFKIIKFYCKAVHSNCTLQSFKKKTKIKNIFYVLILRKKKLYKKLLLIICTDKNAYIKEIKEKILKIK